MFVAVYSLPVEDQKKGCLPYSSKFLFQKNLKNKIKINIEHKGHKKDSWEQ